MKDDTLNQPDNPFDTELINIILKIPAETARLDITATVLGDDGAPRQLTAIMRPSEIHKARQDFLDNVDLKDDYDACWQLTDKGRELLAKLEAGEEIDWDRFGISVEDDDGK